MDSEGISGVALGPGGLTTSQGVGPGVVIGLLGPTASGKTSVAVELARRLSVVWPGPAASANGLGPVVRVISCDSMQVYRGFPVLTNQPDDDKEGDIAHALMSCVDPGESFSVAEYASLAKPLIEEDLALRGWALVAGGAGLYMRAAVGPLNVASAGNSEVRAQLDARATSETPQALHAELARLDPEAARAIDPRNVRRVIRALEVIILTGRPWSGRSDLWSPAYSHPTLLVMLNMAREELYRRIDDRAIRIVYGGAVEEMRRFRESQGLEEGRPNGAGIRSAIGYREIWRYIEGAATLEETVAEVQAATRRYARRQLTWLRKLEDAVIIDVQDRSPEEVAEQILALARSGAHTKEPCSFHEAG